MIMSGGVSSMRLNRLIIGSLKAGCILRKDFLSMPFAAVAIQSVKHKYPKQGL